MAQIRFLLTYCFVLCYLLCNGDFCRANTQDDNTGSGNSIVRVKLQHLGQIHGVRSLGMDFFGGIPYASPPVGNLRFAPPEEPPSWKPHTLDASRFGPECYQPVDPVMNPLSTAEGMSEDCLYLNIYTPAGASSPTRRTKLPVMVWFHGGAFQQGSAKRPEYDARRLAEEEMTIVVTANYRLGALGFLVSSELGLLGNFGLMDQRAVLYFVKKHISRFGGNPNSITLFGESAGAVMIGLHLQMENPGLFHKAILQSNPMGYQFRSVVVADFLGDALKRAVDCRDLQCLRGEPVEEIMRAQSSLMGIPRSAGDFFAWGPILTHHRALHSSSSSSSSWSSANPFRKSPTTAATGTSIIRLDRHPRYFSVDAYGAKQREATKFAVNVSQPMLNLHLIPDHIPIIIGTNKHEGEMFVHGVFPLNMNKPVYWMFVGALFKDSAAKVLRHYRPYVRQLEIEAEAVAKKQIEEEKSKQYYMENESEFHEEYERWVNKTSGKMDDQFIVTPETVEQLVKTFSAGGSQDQLNDIETNTTSNWWKRPFQGFQIPFKETFQLDDEAIEARERLREERAKQRALKEAAKVAIDYRPVMSRIINDYLFRCPSWHFAHLISRNRVHKRKNNNVYVYRFSQPTHIPGCKECWGKSCHTAELPYVFQSIEVIRSNYSTTSQYAQDEAPSTPEYPFTEILRAHRGDLPEDDSKDNSTTTDYSRNYPKSFQKILTHFFDDYFIEDSDEEIASDMSQRWVAFARTGDPNYEDAKVQWIPWRYIPKEEEEVSMDEYTPWEDELGVWSDMSSDVDEGEGDGAHNGKSGNNGFLWSDNKQGRAYRRRALEALHMEVIEEDEMRTELKRTNPNHQDKGSSFLASKFLAALGIIEEDDKDKMPSRSAIRQVQRIAQDMGVLGTGLLRTEDRRNARDIDYWDEDFFPQLLELKWPPEERLVERDCTCDFWDRIGYRY